MKRIGVITNPTSGSGRGRAWGQETLAMLAGGGHQLTDLSLGSWRASYEAAMKARRKLDALVVVGGDGMVHLGLQVCAGTKLPLGIVAAGSGNDVAITMKLPIHDIAAAVRTIEEGLEGNISTMDLGKISGKRVELPASPRYFAAVLSAGIDAAVASYAQRLTYPRGPLKYKVATARELPRFKPYGITVSEGRKSWSQECTLIAIANGPVFGGGLIVSPDSRVDDGELEMVIAEPLSRRDIVRLFPRLYDGSVLSDPRVRVIKGKRFTIEQAPRGATLPPAFADGELVGAEPMVVEAAPRALRVLGGQPG